MSDGTGGKPTTPIEIWHAYLYWSAAVLNVAMQGLRIQDPERHAKALEILGDGGTAELATTMTPNNVQYTFVSCRLPGGKPLLLCKVEPGGVVRAMH